MKHSLVTYLKSSILFSQIQTTIIIFFLSQITNAQQNPVISFLSPKSDTIIQESSSISFSAVAFEQNGSIQKVAYYLGTSKIAESTEAPYKVSFENFGVGTYSIKAKATDALGNSTETCPKILRIVDAATGCSPTPAYAENSGYCPGSRVVNHGKKYECLQWPNSDKCNMSASVYAPGTGSSWQEAWLQLKVCSPSDTLHINACGNTPLYAENGGYGPGSRVVNQGRKYECQEWPNSGWCNGASWAYGPSIGAYWQDAWIDLGSCSGESTDPNPLCGSIPAYTTTETYNAGNQVANLGKVYECRPWPYSGWCNGAAWAYAPGTGTNWTDAWTDKGYCTENGSRQETPGKTVSVRIFPNPAENELHIESKGAFTKANYILRDLNGLTIRQDILSDLETILSLTELPAGIYLLEIRIDGNSKTEKITKL